MESLESILSELQGKYKAPETIKPYKDEQTSTPPLPNQNNNPLNAPATNSLDSLLNDLRNNSQINSQNSAVEYRSPQVMPEVTPIQTSPAIDRDLEQIANRQQNKDREAISKTATEWLKKLDPLDGEGLWFEEFAKNYPSRLEAAIALLQPK
ncbi:MAG: hypothetical protein DCF20_04175 [Pseudanabaena sp.]|nr:MAG: hypothetical protein DCF20_04175 [Pseudanabaena sp.]